MYKRIYTTGLVALAILLWLSVALWQERILFIDSAYYLFRLVTEEGFAIFHFRFAAMFTEILPLLGLKLGLPLQQLAVIYSINIVLFFVLCYLAIGYGLKQYRAGIALLLYLLLFATHTFYFAISELILGCVLLFVFLSAVLQYRNSGSMFVLLIAITTIPIMAFAHPLMVIPFAYALAFMYLHKEEPVKLQTLVWAGGLYLATLAVKAIFFKEPYDAGAMGNLRNFKTYFPNYINLHSNKAFLRHCLTLYYWIPLGSVLVAAVYIRSKQWLKLGLCAAAVSGYLLLINVSYPGENVHAFYIENMYLPIGVFLALPLAFDVLPVLAARSRQLALGLVLLVAAMGLTRIYLVHEPYTARVQWLRQYAKANEGLKIMAHEKHAPMDTLLMSWATPYEFWLLTTTERNRTASIIFLDKIEKVSWGAPLTYDFVTQWGTYSYDSLDKRYFKFADSFATYTVMP